MPRQRLPVFDLEVIVDFVFDDGLLFIKLANIGDKPARRIAVAFDPEIRGLGGAKPISKMRVFRNVEFLAPGREISVFLDTGEEYFRGNQPKEIVVTLTYTDAQGERRKGEIRHDLRIYADVGRVRPAGA